jgi:hypothetical protein
MPFIQYREQRFQINKTAMDRKFEIEKALANFVTAQTVIPVEATEDWSPNDLEFPEDATNLQTLAGWQEHQLKNGITTVADIVVDMGKADTLEAAEELVAKNREKNRAAGVGQPQEQQQRQGGTLGRLLGRGNDQQG